MERSKKKVHLWKKAIVHFSLCFVMGFFTGFAPTGRNSSSSSSSSSSSPVFSHHVISTSQPQPAEILHRKVIKTQPHNNVNRSLVVVAETPLPTTRKYKSKNRASEETEQEEVRKTEHNAGPKRRLVIIVTPTSMRDKFRGVFLRRLANTIKLVSQPLLWIVVESQSNSDEGEVSAILRKTGVMYRHLVFKENFTDTEAELDHQRNVALKHIEQHRLSGIVHFAGLDNVYDLAFFDQLRDIEVFGTWAMALLSANKQKVVIEGPVCDSSQVIGWHLNKIHNNDDQLLKPPLPIHISSFAFNSSILWDPERWGRPSSLQHTSQNSIKFVKQVVLEDDTKLKGIPPEECSKIMLWSLHLPTHHHSDQTISTVFDSISDSR
ncbi:hypothetical protein Ddye_015212 [Dipteronia dyeriana]|uniref:Glycosyltransferases n=1 Tax=Dipteronia dyeriana TaxID=168575 RepID=A0AAD9U562_9ROSI|nr:hypothetical protein Ddye_015212 [Dipteronia dyeriana]